MISCGDAVSNISFLSTASAEAPLRRSASTGTSTVFSRLVQRLQAYCRILALPVLFLELRMLANCPPHRQEKRLLGSLAFFFFTAG